MGWGISNIANSISRPVQQIGSSVSHALNPVSNALGAPIRGVGNAIGGDVGHFLSRNANGIGGYALAPGVASVQTGADISKHNPMGVAGSAFGPMGTGIGVGLQSIFGMNDKSPQAPGLDPGLQSVHKQQLDAARDFRANLPQYEQGMYENLRQANNNQLSQGLENVDASTSRRGLLYGGINQGGRAKMRGQANMALARERADVNSSMLNAADKMDQMATGTGVNMQAAQQSIQDQIYQQALTKMMMGQQGFGSLLGAGAMAGAIALA